MEQIISEYQKLLNLIAEEEQQAARCLQGELFEVYRDILRKEREKIERNLRALHQINL